MATGLESPRDGHHGMTEQHPARRRHVVFAALGYVAGRQARPQAALADQIPAVMS
jgi:hypothetical protein